MTSSFGAGSYDVYLIRTDANGDTIWTRTYGGPYWDYGFWVEQTFPDSGFIIAGYTGSCNGDACLDVYLIKTDANGDTLWTRSYGGASNDEAYSVQQTSSGGYIVVGRTKSFGAGSWDVYLIKTDANGDTLWTRTYGGPHREVGHSIQETSYGTYIIAGETVSFGAGWYDVYLISTDTSGNILWTQTYGGTDSDGGISVQQTSDGGYIVTGSGMGPVDPCAGCSGSSDVYLIRLAPEEPVTPGSIAGGVVANCPAANTGLLGVTVDAFDSATEELVASGVTDETGAYTIPDLPAGDYRVSIVTPLGYLAVGDDETFLTVGGGETATADFSLTCIDLVAEPRSRSYWKHQVSRIIKNIEKDQNKPTDFTAEDMIGFLGAIDGHFAQNALNPISLYDGSSASSQLDSLKLLKELLAAKKDQVNEQEKRVRKGKGELMALLLNVASEKISQVENISEDNATVSQAITYSWSLLTDSITCTPEEEEGDEDHAEEECDCQHKKAEKILKKINHGKTVKAELIPPETDNISYKQPRAGERPAAPAVFSVSPNAPNPFNPSTTIRFSLPVAGGYSLSIHDTAGRLVRRLTGTGTAGENSLVWDGKSDSGRPVSSGIYFYTVWSGSHNETRKMVLAK